MTSVEQHPPSENRAVTELIARSNRLGADPRNTNYAGGNTSAKGTETDPVTSEPVELLWVKGSGGDLGTLTAAGLAVLRLDRLRALVERVPGRGARGRDGGRVRLLPARQGRRRPVDRHGHARPGRRRPRRPPAPGLGHRAGHGRGRRSPDPAVLRRPGGVGAVAAPGLPARPGHRRDQGGQPAGHRLHPRRARHHRLGRHQRTSARPARWRSSVPRRRSWPSTAAPTRSARCSTATARSTPTPGTPGRPRWRR